MTDKPPPDAKTLTDDEREAEQRFQATLGRLVNTPHQPHKPKEGAASKGRQPR